MYSTKIWILVLKLGEMLQADREHLAHNGPSKNMKHVEKKDKKISRVFKVLLHSDIQAYSSEHSWRKHVAKM